MTSSAEWDARYAGRELVWSAEPNRFVAEETADLTPGTALDLACGEGRNAIWLAERGWTVTAVDFSAVALDKARQLAARRGVEVDWRHDDVAAPGPPWGAFDLVLVVYLQLPAPARDRALHRAAASLAPGGTIVVVGHHAANLTEGHGGPQDPAVLYGPDEVTAALAGLTVVRADRVEREVATEDGPRTAIDVLVRARRDA